MFPTWWFCDGVRYFSIDDDSVSVISLEWSEI